MTSATEPARPTGLAVYLVYRDVAAIADWMTRALGFVEKGRTTDPDGVVTNIEMRAGQTVLLLERGDVSAAAYPRGTRWTGVWADDPDASYQRLCSIGVDASEPEDEPWGVRLVRVVDPEGHVWALIKRTRP